MRIEQVGYTHPDAVVLIAEVQQEYAARYGSADASPADPAEFAAPWGRFLVGYLAGTPVACGGWHALGTDAEIRRMYVTRAARRRGFARAILAGLAMTD